MFLTFTTLEITEQQPDYAGFTNNCQNFGQYLVKRICEGVIVAPKTFRQSIQKMLFVKVCESASASSTTAKSAVRTNMGHRKLPGAYPVSIPSRATPLTDLSVFYSAQETWSILSNSVLINESVSLDDSDPFDGDTGEETDGLESAHATKISLSEQDMDFGEAVEDVTTGVMPVGAARKVEQELRRIERKLESSRVSDMVSRSLGLPTTPQLSCLPANVYFGDEFIGAFTLRPETLPAELVSGVQLKARRYRRESYHDFFVVVWYTEDEESARQRSYSCRLATLHTNVAAFHQSLLNHLHEEGLFGRTDHNQSRNLEIHITEWEPGVALSMTEICESIPKEKMGLCKVDS